MSNRLLDNPTRILNWINTEAGALFLEEIKDRREIAIGKLCREKDQGEVNRLQGEIKTLNSILTVPDEIQTYLRDKTAGKVKQ